MDATKISEAIKLISEKKENLRKAFDALEPYSSSLSTFTLQWKDLEDHISSIESSIYERFNAYHHQQQDIDSTTTTTMEKNYNNNSSNTNATPRPELKSLCANMDAKGLRSFISTNRDALLAIRHELAMALRSAPDPALLVLDAMDGFHPPNPPPPILNRRGVGNQEGELQISRRICVHLLENLCLISPEIEINDFVKEMALKLAVEWKGQIPRDNVLPALGFLELIAAYGLVSEFEVDDVMELFVSVSSSNHAVDLIKSLGFVDMAHDIIQKLSSKGRQLDAVKIVYALNIVDKFPPVPLLKAYIQESKKKANELRKKGNKSRQSLNDATAKEIRALNLVLKAVQVHNLGKEYPPEILLKNIAQLEDQKKGGKKKSGKKRTSASKPLQKQQFNKRPRPSPATFAPATSYNPYMSVPSTAMVHGGAGAYGIAVGQGGTRGSPRPYYPPESLVGNHGYPFAGVPSPYDPSMYP